MKVELNDIYKIIDGEHELWDKRAVSNNKIKMAHSALNGLKHDLEVNFPEYVVCFGDIFNQFGGALAILSNDSSTIRDVRVLRLKPQQAREKLESGDIVFSQADLAAYGETLLKVRDIAMIEKATMTKQDFIDTYLTEEAIADDNE